MTSEPGSAGVSGQDSVVLASFESYRAAEHMVASLGGEFRRKARKGGAAAAVDNAKASWDGPLTEFLAALDPGPAHDWVRKAVGEPSHTKG
jgi:hypothetical protein